MFNYGLKKRHFPPYVGNPFSELPVDRMKIEDAKPIFVFTEELEYQCFLIQHQATDQRSFHDWLHAEPQG